MNDHVITNIADLRIEWFNHVLSRSRTVLTGGVAHFEAQPIGSENSHLAKIQLEYQAGSTGKLPTHLLLKMCGGAEAAFGSSEVNYCSRDYIDLADAPIPTCYDIAYSDQPRQYHILMDDLSATHHNNWQTTPTQAYGFAVADALALLHAHYWTTDRLGTIGESRPGEAHFKRYIDHIQPGLEPLIADLGDDIDPSWVSTLRDVFKYHPARMVERAAQPIGITLVHGDVNPGNILSPLGGQGKTYLIDRQPFDWSLTVWLGVSDLAYMMVHWWASDIRRQFEFPILHRYHDSLRKNGVTNYTWEQLVDDYRLAAVQSIYVATEWCVLEQDRIKMRWLWTQQLQKAMSAFDDLRCAELWQRGKDTPDSPTIG